VFTCFIAEPVPCANSVSFAKLLKNNAYGLIFVAIKQACWIIDITKFTRSLALWCLRQSLIVARGVYMRAWWTVAP
jgi:hypothetical protein